MSHHALLAFCAAGFGVLTALIALFRERRSLAMWLFAAGMVLLSLESLFSGLNENAMQVADKVYWENWAVVTRALLGGTWLFFSLIFARGNYREFLAKWRPALAAAYALPVVAVILYQGRMVVEPSVTDLETHFMFHFNRAGQAVFLVSLVAAVLVLMQLERTFWASVGSMRWRIKFMILGLAVLFSLQVYFTSQVLLFHGLESSQTIYDSGALLLACLLMLRSLFRGLSGVALYPALTDLHKSLAMLVAGIYLMIVGVFARVEEVLKENRHFSEKAFFIGVALVALVVVLLSDRVRMYTRRLISRYLQRPLYDYRTVWRRFTEGTASRVTGKELCQASVKLAADLFQALSVSIWVMDDKGENFELAASTSLSDPMAQKLQPSREEAAELIRAMRHHREPVEMEYCNENWAVTLRRCHPSEFEEGGSRVCVPMIAAGQLLGLMLLGDRVGGELFSLQDYDLLKCVGDQIAASLLNSRLSQKLLQAKELEAFQTMSAFFVHDLKNTASTLNLMLQNLPVHFDNPAFREDALRGIAKSGQHINNLIGRLSVLRRDLQIHPQMSDLNELVSKILASWKGSPSIQLDSHLGPIPKFRFDPEQVHKVVTNLVLNAAEAVPANGRIRVQTTQADGWVVLTVQDNGCGMTPDFLQGSLFRPFQTTKKEGFGIGMFQSKMIVEAHGGRVEVESQLNQGTTFRVLLPANTNSQ
jgi:putative PEP-CTERM system histidine kinase